MNAGLVAANATPRCKAHTKRGPCKNPATTGMMVCHTHGGRAPQVKAAAALRLAMAADTLVKRLLEIANNKKHPQQLAAIKEGLERNRLYAFGVTPPQEAGQRTVNYTQVNTNVAAMTDVELDDYRQLLRELKALLAEEAPKVIEGMVAP
jgi:hypothetical protein